MMKKVFLAFWVLLLLASCSRTTPKKIHYDQDVCAYCGMMISDKRYGSELITKKGKVYKFDSITCMIAFANSNGFHSDRVASYWVVDFDEKGFVNASQAVYLYNPKIHPPMGLPISAFKNEQELDSIKNKYGGRILSWEKVLSLVKEKWLVLKRASH
ncbi:MAG: nitrous oxide reductase accessory protein NosL [Candidatus Eremiobacteraeota bacterium]|jgi:copper chaperone NosL|nr:nitrous oxide reductase accessory protein NosL [Candidatus Eremiobacteraeota bacterium]MCL5055362.1 nitrous oxide reductase accessory protein NosL [Bacillota bacterium]